MRDLCGTCKNIKNFVACAVSRSFCRLAANHPEFLGCGLLYQTVVSKANSGLQREMTTWARAFMGKSYQAPWFETLSLAVYDGVNGCGICVVHARTSRILLHAQSQGLSADLRPTTLSFWAVACCIKQWSPKGNDHVGPCFQGLQKLSGTMF